MLCLRIKCVWPGKVRESHWGDTSPLRKTPGLQQHGPSLSLSLTHTHTHTHTHTINQECGGVFVFEQIINSSVAGSHMWRAQVLNWTLGSHCLESSANTSHNTQLQMIRIQLSKPLLFWWSPLFVKLLKPTHSRKRLNISLTLVC